MIIYDIIPVPKVKVTKNKPKKNLFYFLILLVLLQSLGGFLFFPQIKKALAVDCGDGYVACSCGNILMANYTLTDNLSCSGTALTIGADVTLNGGGFSITGNGTGVGIDNTGHVSNITNVTIDNFATGIQLSSVSVVSTIGTTTLQNNLTNGIYLNNSSNIILDNLTLSNNTTYGIRLNSSLDNHITNSSVTGGQYGLYMVSSDGNTLDNLTVSNTVNYGATLNTSQSNVLTRVSLTGNNKNLNITSLFNNTIDTTNTVESKKIVYLYNQNGSQGSPLVYDGDILGSIGMFWAISSSYLEVKDAVLADNSRYGVYFNNVSSSTVSNITTGRGLSGIYLNSSSNNTIATNTLRFSSNEGLYLGSSCHGYE